MAGPAGAPRRRKKKEIEEEHINHERWLVTYADMVTLLMVLFIVMFAISQVDQDKYNALRQSLSVGFGDRSPLVGASSPAHSQNATSATYSIRPTDLGNVAGPSGDAAQDVEQKLSQQKREQQYAHVRAEANRLEELRKRIMAALANNGLAADVRTTVDGRGLTVSLVSHRVVFEPNLAALTRRGQRIVDTIAPVLAELPDQFEIEGHTNQQGGRAAKYYDSDWDLASARAVTVLRRLNEQHHISDQQLRASSFGMTRPLVDPDLPGSQQLNKRVDIVVLAQLTEEEKTMLTEVVGATEGNR